MKYSKVVKQLKIENQLAAEADRPIMEQEQELGGSSENGNQAITKNDISAMLDEKFEELDEKFEEITGQLDGKDA